MPGMRRRDFVMLLGVSASCYRVAPSVPNPESSMFNAFVQGLHELGYAEGRNLILERRYAEWRPERLRALAAELAGAGVDVIVAFVPTRQRFLPLSWFTQGLLWQLDPRVTHDPGPISGLGVYQFAEV